MKTTWLNDYQHQLSEQIVQNRLPHALLITGVNGAGKQVLAEWLIQVLLCQQPQQTDVHNGSYYSLQPCGQCKHCQLLKAGSFPDHQTISSDKATIGVDEVRKSNAFLQKTAQLSGNKTVFIPKAHTMTESAANALLKTLEEPSDRSHIILIANDTARLLPTIVSRCRLISLRVPKHAIEDSRFKHSTEDAYTNLTHIAELSDTETQQTFQHFNTLFSDFLIGDDHQALLTFMLANEDAMRWCEKAFADMLRYSNGWHCALSIPLQQLLSKHVLSPVIIRTCHQIYIDSHKQLMTLAQANKTFVLEAMLIKIKQQLNHIQTTAN